MAQERSDALRMDAERIAREAIARAMPEAAVRRALSEMELGARPWLIAVGKAAWPMANAANQMLGGRVAGGVVITKYGHAKGEIPGLEIYEAGHPVPDENGLQAARRALELARALGAGDEALFLLSGGGSALFEDALVPLGELQDVTRQLLACGADIREINAIRKRLSGVKGGRFAQVCAPARVRAILLSDVLGDAADAIASGPVCPDSTTCAQAREIARRYDLRLSPRARALLDVETPKEIDNVELREIGSVRQLCQSAADAARALGYRPILLTAELCCAAREAGSFMASIARTHANATEPLAFIAGGETVVRLTGSGKGGRNQELALAAAEGLDGLSGAALISVGSDGTDGPTDAAGGYVDGDTRRSLAERGLRIADALDANDSYRALAACGGLVFTGPTGTNVNDLTLLLIRR